MKKANVDGIFFIRLFFIALISFPVYLISAAIPIPSLLGLGETRLVLIVVLSRICEEGLYRGFKKFMLQTMLEEEPIKR